jgi:hypothetical protein
MVLLIKGMLKLSVFLSLAMPMYFGILDKMQGKLTQISLHRWEIRAG